MTVCLPLGKIRHVTNHRLYHIFVFANGSIGDYFHEISSTICEPFSTIPSADHFPPTDFENPLTKRLTILYSLLYLTLAHYLTRHG